MLLSVFCFGLVNLPELFLSSDCSFINAVKCQTGVASVPYFRNYEILEYDRALLYFQCAVRSSCASHKVSFRVLGNYIRVLVCNLEKTWLGYKSLVTYYSFRRFLSSSASFASFLCFIAGSLQQPSLQRRIAVYRSMLRYPRAGLKTSSVEIPILQYNVSQHSCPSIKYWSRKSWFIAQILGILQGGQG